MFRAPLCPSSGAQEYFTGGCCLVFGAVKMEAVIYKLNGIRVFWVLSIVCFIGLLWGMSSVVGVVCGYHLVGVLFPHVCTVFGCRIVFF